MSRSAGISMEESHTPPASESLLEGQRDPVSSSSSAQDPLNEEGEDECRVCRGGDELGSLFTPCKCSGSIRHVHQECLEMWLRHKNSTSEKCELCGCVYGFSPRYADDAPSSLGGLSLTVALVRRVFLYGVPTLFSARNTR